MADCRKCHHLSYVNQHKLDTANKLRISYQTPEVVGCLSYPRCYTISTDNYEEFAISIGPTHQQGISKYLIRGEWLIEEEPKIMFTFVLDEAVQFNHIVMCSRISLVLEAVAFAEIALLTQFPLYQDTPIIISFLCNHSDFQRQEPWNTIGDWLPPLSSPRTPLKKNLLLLLLML